jgi:hypothetical protein
MNQSAKQGLFINKAEKYRSIVLLHKTQFYAVSYLHSGNLICIAQLTFSKRLRMKLNTQTDLYLQNLKNVQEENFFLYKETEYASNINHAGEGRKSPKLETVVTLFSSNN